MDREEFRRSVEENLGRDPVQIALDGKVPDAAAVASQVKYLKRAEHKLPSYHAARCVLPPLAFEQSSSEAAAARKNYSGRLCIDLTCGLGVDAFFLAKKFERVIAVERDPELAATCRENFRLLGADNIEVVCNPAEGFLAGFGDPGAWFDARADLIYIDPDRRGAGGKKMVRIEDCSPDVVALLPLIRRIAPRLVVKLSPLFDVDEVFRIFGGNSGSNSGGNGHGGIMSAPRPSVRVEVVSLGGECKEIVAEVVFPGPAAPSAAPPSRTVCAVAIDLGEVCYPFEEWSAPEQSFEPERYRWLIVPDVALQKARLARRYFSEHGGNAPGGVYIDSDNGYGFAAELPPVPPPFSPGAPPLMGKVLEIVSVEPFDPRALKRRLKMQGIRNVDIFKRNFPLSAADIAHGLGIREGGKSGTGKSAARTAIAFTRAAGRLWQVMIRQ